MHQIVLSVIGRRAIGCAVQGIQSISCQFLRCFDFLIGEFDVHVGNGQIKSIHCDWIIGITSQVDEVCVTGHGCAAYITC